MISAPPTRPPRRTLWACVTALALSGVLSACSASADATADESGSASAGRASARTSPAPADERGGPKDVRPALGSGKLLKATALPERDRPHGGPGHVVEYASTGADGRKVTVSGLVFAPAGKPPAQGWPVISLTHGTVGNADSCAPSRTDPGLPHDPSLRGWLDSGVAVVATDYEGLGAPGPHPYLHSRSAAFGTVDIVRAARQGNPGISRTWVAMGQSQGGHAAVSTAVYATRYAPGLDFRGAVATAPPTEMSRMVSDRSDSTSDERAMRTALYPLVMDGLQAVDPDLDLRRLFSPRAEGLLPLARTTCFNDLFTEVRRTGVNDSNAWAQRPETDPDLMNALREHVDTPVLHLDRPLFIGQGAKDEIVQASVTSSYAQRLQKAGSDVTYRQYPRANHITVVEASDPEVTTWIKKRFASRP